jgi:Uma2 family endonuclease
MRRDAPDAKPQPPRAPTESEWARLSALERAAVVEALPAAMGETEASPPEGDLHYDAKNDARATLREWYRRLGRSVYVAAELTTYYPGEARFAPDVLAVRDVPVHDRTKWVVSAEGKGLEWVLEVHVGGDRKKDAELNVSRYARLGIPEYFIYDRARQHLLGYRLAAAGARTYSRIVPQAGRYPSEILGLDLALQDGNLRFFHANAELLPPQDLAERLERMLAEVAAERDAEAERAQAEAERAQAEAERAQAEAERAQAEAERAQAADLEIERLKDELARLRREPE